MIDIHSHILPAVDDGAQNLADALELLQLAQDDGVTTQYLTPHMRPPRYVNEAEALRREFDTFAKLVADKGFSIKLHLSAEVRVGPEIMPLLQRDDFPWLGQWQGKKAFLLEMPHGQVPTGTINLINWLLQRDILPVIAHPERNREFQSNIKLVEQYVQAGCLMQITAASLLGKFNDTSERAAIQLLENDLVTFMATDSHNNFHRPPDLNAGYERAKEFVSEEKARSYVYDAPARLLANHPSTEIA